MKTIVLGITGSIAAYKSAEIVRAFCKKGYNVNCVMTEGAKEFVTPLTLRTLSGNAVYDDMFYEAKRPDVPVEHIGLAKNCEVILIAPATANIIGKIASGIADDLLTTVVMATNQKIYIAPAMNTGMWTNPIVQGNVEKLKKLGYEFIGPKTGGLACGDVGEGHIEDIDVIVKSIINKAVKKGVKKNGLTKKKVLITSGATREKIDDVRFISNPSSGKTGYFLAQECLKRGAEVIYVTGKSSFIPSGCKVIEVESAENMLKAVKKHVVKVDVVIGAAAVGDFTPSEVFNGKLTRNKKTGTNNLKLELVPTVDILAEVGKNKGKKILIGYSAESGNSLTKTIQKIKNKKLDYIVYNNISDKSIGFESDNNEIIIMDKNGKSIYKGKDTKENLAAVVIDAIEKKV